jgi:hypothetical protein
MSRPDDFQADKAPYTQELQRHILTQLKNYQSNLVTKLAQLDWTSHLGLIFIPKGGDDRYAYFSPLYHFMRGVMTIEDIIELVEHKEKKAMVVGTGYGFLEEVLIETGVQPNQIHSADIDLTRFTETELKGKITSHQFNMYEEWPHLEETFDFILFPEAFPELNQGTDSNEIIQKLTHVLHSSSRALKETGIIRMSSLYMTQEMVEEIQKLCPNLVITFDDKNVLTAQHRNLQVT